MNINNNSSSNEAKCAKPDKSTLTVPTCSRLLAPLPSVFTINSFFSRVFPPLLQLLY